MSSVGILFPGQGAQAVGMGRWLCDHHTSARAYFDRASEVLGYDLSSLCFDGPEAKLNEEGAQLSSYNNFQGRYIMLNRWEGKIECENPQRGIWGGPPNGGSGVTAAENTAFAKRGTVQLDQALAQESIPTVNLLPEGPYKVDLPKPPRAKGMCACRTLHSPDAPSGSIAWIALGMLALGVRRRKHNL